MITVPKIKYPEHRLGNGTINFQERVAVMAIVNRTPDSFYDKGKTFGLDSALAAGARAFENGADLLDVGGVKFAPGPELPVSEEIERVIPLVREMSPLGPVSVDTFQPRVAAAAIEAGAAVINDTTGVHDPEMAKVVAGTGVSLVVAHSIAKPRTKIAPPKYIDVVKSILDFFDERIELALSNGVSEEQIIVDPGHDLNKNTLQTLELTRRLEELSQTGYPLLVALSNKDFIGESLGKDRHERLYGSISSAVFCATQGARIVRVHNVPETVDAMRMFETTMAWREPVFLKHNMSPEEARDA